MSRFDLSTQLTNYSALSDQEEDFRRQMLWLLRTESFPFHRDSFPAHFTGSMFVVSPDHQRMLLLHHKKLGYWLQPGGHSDGDTNTFQVALRELQEETGLQVQNHPRNIFDLDIHPIPAHKHEPEHFHYDVRFLVEVDPGCEIIIDPKESADFKWFSLDEVAQLHGWSGWQRVVAKLGK